VFAWYTLTGSLATALGALCGGTITQTLQKRHHDACRELRVVVFSYAALGVVLAILFTRLSSFAEVSPAPEGEASPARVTSSFGITRSRHIVLKLSSLFALDSFAGGFVVQSFAAYWFYLRFGVRPGALGAIFFWANIFAGISALLASRLAARIGLIRTMVFTHLPSNVLLILVPLMPDLTLAVLVLLVRFSISQMDVPARQSYTMAVVSPEERSAAGGITGVARTTGAAISPLVCGVSICQTIPDKHPIFRRRITENPLRSVALQGIAALNRLRKPDSYWCSHWRALALLHALKDWKRPRRSKGEQSTAADEVRTIPRKVAARL